MNIVKKYFFIPPFWSWLILSMIGLVLLIAGYQYEKRQINPDRLFKQSQANFQYKLGIAENEWNTTHFGYDNGGKLILSNDLLITVVQNDHIIDWNHNNFTIPKIIIHRKEEFKQGKAINFSNYSLFLKYYQYPAEDGSDSLSFFLAIPIKVKYDIENKYFTSKFFLNKHASAYTQVSNEPLDDSSYKVLASKENSAAAFYLTFSKDTSYTFKVSNALVYLLMFTCFTFFVWSYKFYDYITLTKGFRKAFIFFAINYALYVSYYLFGKLPIGFINVNLFSPQLVASGYLIKSLGEFFLLVLLHFWGIYTIVYSVYIYPDYVKKQRQLPTFVAVLVLISLYVFLYGACSPAIYKLVLDSKISFDVDTLLSIDIYSILGIIVILLICVIGIITIFLITVIAQNISFRYPVRLGIVIGMNLLVVIISSYIFQQQFYYILFVITGTIYVVIEYATQNKPTSNFLDTFDSNLRRYSFIAIVSIVTSSFVFYFNIVKERHLRKAYAEKLVEFQDFNLVFEFEELAEQLSHDSVLNSTLHQDNYDEYKYNAFNEYIFSNFLKDNFLNYNIRIYCLDASFKQIDTVTNFRIPPRILNIAEKSPNMLTFLNPQHIAQSLYAGYVPIIDKDGNTTANLVFEIRNNREQKYSNLQKILDPAMNNTESELYEQYDFVIINSGRIFNTTDNNLDVDIPSLNEQLSVRNYVWEERTADSKLSVKTEDGSIIMVIYNRNIFLQALSLFCIVISLLIICVYLNDICKTLFLKSNPFKSLRSYFFNSLGVKINLFLMSLISLIFIVVGILTVNFLINKYNKGKVNDLKVQLHFLGRTASDHLHTYQDNNPTIDIHKYLHSNAFYLILEDAAILNQCDINFYNAEGRLIKSTQNIMLERGLISSFINPTVLDLFRLGARKELIINESVGEIVYKSAYVKLLDRQNKVIGYLNIPYYATKDDLNNEIAEIGIRLLNVYIMTFLLAGLITLSISNRIINRINLLIDKLKRVKLSQNHLVEWEAQDEVGMLISEYNIMIQKVESLAKRLAVNERESAWKDIARQVAHEIKNPLTPMKLNLQYLQSAIQSGRADVPQLTERIAKSILEQIDHLTVIASEFSNLAKMPEAKKEVIDGLDTLEQLGVLFREADMDLIIEYTEPFKLFIDKSQFIRVFTNLFTNALQAIPDDRRKHIEVKFLRMQGAIVISIHDNGRGIPEDKRDKLFSPYFTTKSSGTGIGLFMSKNIIEQSEGQIWFESEENVGTIFYVKLPLHEG